jgi:PTS system nitrogen regulatory IIA component
VANRTYLIYQEDEVLAAVRAREQLYTTALPGGVAIPHPRRPMPDAIAESLIAFGRTTNGIPFGPRGQLTDVFFLVLCRDDRTHLQVLARLSRMLQREEFLDRLRAADTAAIAYNVIQQTEVEVVG